MWLFSILKANEGTLNTIHVKLIKYFALLVFGEQYFQTGPLQFYYSISTSTSVKGKNTGNP